MVGMGAMMGGTMRSPITGIVFVLELTHDLEVLPAVFVGTVAALCVTVLLLRRSILTEKLARRGQHIAREYSVDVFELVRVGDVMQVDVPSVTGSSSIRELSSRIADNDSEVSARHAVVIVDGSGRMAGILTRGDLLRALGKDPSGKMTVLEACTPDPVVTWMDETLSDALTTMLKHDIGRMPVVDRKDPLLLRGYLGRAEILIARSRHQEDEDRRERGPLVAAASRRARSV
jgi:CBS domain-containing protein